MTKSPTYRQKHLILFLLDYPNKWHSHKDTDVVCACVNLGIAKINEYH